MMRRSIFDLRPAPQSKVDDLKAFITQFGFQRGMFQHKGPAAEAALNREIAQFIAVRACLRMRM